MFAAAANAFFAFAEGTNNVITYWTVTDSLISPLFTAINSNIDAAIPYGLGIMGSFLGVNVLKRIIYTFI